MTAFYKEFAKFMSHYNLINDEVIISVATPLPPHPSDYDLAIDFSNFF